MPKTKYGSKKQSPPKMPKGAGRMQMMKGEGHMMKMAMKHK